MEKNRMTREEMIGNIISGRYSINDQIALLRQKDTKPEEWAAFDAYAEEVKRKVTEEYKQIEAKEAAEAAENPIPEAGATVKAAAKNGDKKK